MLTRMKRLMTVLGLCIAVVSPPALSGMLKRQDVDRWFDGQFIVGEVDAAMPVYPLFEKPAAGSGGQPALKGYAFETIDFKPVRGYSGKPINVLVAMDLQGTFIDLRLIDHREPFFSNPTGHGRLANFVYQYVDLSVRHTVRVLDHTGQSSREDQSAELQGVKHGTVSAASINRTILTSAADIALTKLGMSESAVARRRGSSEHFRHLSWTELLDHGMIGTTTITRGEIERQFANTRSAGADELAGARPDEAALIFHVALLTQPLVGRSLINAEGWRYLNGNRRSAHVLMVTEQGPLAFAEEESLRVKDEQPFTLKQHGKELKLRVLPYEKALAVPGYPNRTRAHLLVIDKSTPLNTAEPFELDFRLARKFGTNQVMNKAEERSFRLDYDYHGWKTRLFDFVYTDWAEVDWVKVWISRSVDIAVLLGGLVVLAMALLMLRLTSATATRLRVFRIAYLLFTLGFIGWYAQGQITVINVTAALESLSGGGDLGFMLNDPMTVIIWLFTGVTLVLWGRSTFCGWLCPFGALQELISLLANAIGIRQRRLRTALDAHLKKIKYVVLAVIVGSAFAAPSFAELAVKVEPFETAISFFFVREWPYIAWAAVCLALGILVYRGYCRYICPLGAALACLGILRRWNWIPRRSECGTPCQSCRHRCEYQAIAPSGKIDYSECFQCLDCVALYQDDHRCLPLIRQRKDGEFKSIPIHHTGEA